MKTSELIAAVGDDVIAIQPLDQCAISLNHTAKSGTRITFGTEMPLIPFKGTEQYGLIVWMPRDKLKAVMDAAKKVVP